MKTIRAEVRVVGDTKVEIKVADDATDRQIQDVLELKALKASEAYGLSMVDCEVEWYDATAVIAGSDLVQVLADTPIKTLPKEQQEQFIRVCRLTIDALKKLATPDQS